MACLDDKTLQRLHDGDLSSAELQTARERLADSPEDLKRLDSLVQLRTLLRGAAQQDADEADLDGLWDRIRGSLGAARPPSLWERLRLWLGASMGAHPFRWVGAGAAVTALAVTVTLFALPRPGAETVTTPKADVVPNQLEIEALDFRGRHPDIYQIREGERSTTVIWVHPDEEESDQEDPRAPAGGPEDI
jgi:hypothetical protein